MPTTSLPPRVTRSLSVLAEPTALLPCTVVMSVLGISKNTVYRWTREGRLPAPLKIGPNSTRWRAADIRAYVEGAPQREQQEVSA